MDRLDRYHWMTEGHRTQARQAPIFGKVKRLSFLPLDFSGRSPYLEKVKSFFFFIGFLRQTRAADKLQLFAPPSTFHFH